MKPIYLFIVMLLISTVAYTQASVYGKITDEITGEELMNTNISFYKNGVLIAKTATDFYGNYCLTLDPGFYEVTKQQIGYPSTLITDFLVKDGNDRLLNMNMVAICCFCTYVVKSYKSPLIKADQTTSEETITSKDIKRQATKNISELSHFAPGVSLSNF